MLELRTRLEIDPTIRIRLGHDLTVLRPTLHNGPGWRIGLWTQGCVHRCTAQCLSPHLLDPRGGHEYKVDDVVNALRAVIGGLCPHVEGLTVLGGEPFEQPEAVARVITPLREAGLSTMVYSGHTLTRLRATDDPHIQKLLSVVDLLVDGPFLPDLYSETLAWRGSTNQRIQCLTSRYTPAMLERAFAEQGKGFSIQVAPHRISVSGLQSRPAAEVVERMLGIDHS